MLISLFYKYFFYNKKRTFRAIFILSIGLTLIISTNLILTGYLTVVRQFSEDSGLGNTSSITVLPNENRDFSASELNQIYSITDEKDYITDTLETNIRNQQITIDGVHSVVNVMIANITQLFELNEIFIDNIDNQTIYLFQSFFNVVNGSDIQLSYNDLELENYSINSYTSEDLVTSDLIIPISFLNQYIGNITYNRIDIFLESFENIDQLIGELEELSSITVVSDFATEEFLISSANQISNILILLQLSMVTLLILSITYIMVSLIHDSEKDIRLMHMLGLDKRSIWFIYIMQSTLASILACVLSIIISILLLYLLFSLITPILGLPFGVINFNWLFIFQTFIITIFTGIVSGIYPTYKGVNK